MNQYDDNTEMLCENTFTQSPNGMLQPIATQMKSALKPLRNQGSASDAATRKDARDGCDNDTSVTIAELPVIDDLSIIEVETNGFDPYNSGSFDSTKFGPDK